MAVLTQPNNLQDALKWEQENKYSRDEITVTSGQNLAVLTVIAIVTASGKAVILDPAGADGSEDAAGILIADCDASAADTKAVAVVRDAIIVPDNLVWPAGIVAGEITAALAQLDALGIITRSEA